MASRAEAIKLYRELIRHGSKFSNYNFREYALRRAREDFRTNRAVSDPSKVAELMAEGYKELEIVKRQSALSSMFRPDKEYVINMRRKTTPM